MSKQITQHEFNKRRIKEAARSVHPVLVQAIGTTKAPSRKQIERSLAAILGWASKNPEIERWEQDHLVVMVNRHGVLYPTFQVYVAASPRLFFREDVSWTSR